MSARKSPISVSRQPIIRIVYYIASLVVSLIKSRLFHVFSGFPVKMPRLVWFRQNTQNFQYFSVFSIFPVLKDITSHTFISLTAAAAAAIYRTECIHAGGLTAWYLRSVHMYNLPCSSYEFIWRHICTEIDVVSQSTEGKHLTKQQILSALLNYYTY